MSRIIRVSDDVYESLKRLAVELNEPFVHPNTILRFILELDEDEPLIEQLIKRVPKA